MKPLNIFKPTDFTVSHGALTPYGMAEVANRILNQWIKENGVRVYGIKNQYGLFNFSEYSNPEKGPSVGDEYTALIIEIEPIKTCEHKEAVYVEDQDKTWFKCRDCGKPVKAKGWETV